MTSPSVRPRERSCDCPNRFRVPRSGYVTGETVDQIKKARNSADLVFGYSVTADLNQAYQPQLGLHGGWQSSLVAALPPRIADLVRPRAAHLTAPLGGLAAAALADIKTPPGGTGGVE